MPPELLDPTAIPARMESSVEYLFAASIRLSDEAARRQGWRVYGRTGWLKPDGGEVNFICLEEQPSVVGKDVTNYFVGELSEKFKRFKGKWTRLHRWHGPMQLRMRILIGMLSASLIVTVAVSAGPAQAGFCQYQYKHCVARCASKVIKIKRRCFPACRMQLHHCKTPDPHLGELTGTR